MVIKQKHSINDPGGKLSFASSKDALKKLTSKYIGETEKNLILADRNTAEHCLPLLKELFPLSVIQHIVIDAGEDRKDVASLHHIWKKLIDHGADRNTVLINLGGGMITDIGGFAASTFKRGIPFVNIPTSLMGMADAAIGGKTGINIGDIKNQAGSFAQAEEVIIYPGFLNSLPFEELRSGYAEMIKTALVSNSSLFEKIYEIDPDPSRDEFIDKISHDILPEISRIKEEITKDDPYDVGIRQCLNFGHTIGHGIEAYSLQAEKKISHGHAIAAGMICETFISSTLGMLSDHDAQKVIGLLTKIYPHYPFHDDDINYILKLIRHDKKNKEGKIRMSLISAPGKCKYGISCPDELIKNSLSRYIRLG